MQKYARLYDYIHEFQDLLYRFYAKDAVAFLCTYYNLNKETTVWDDENLMGGSYEDVGELTGMRWNKILLLPVFFVDEVSTMFDGREEGYIKDGETNIIIPSAYGILPYPNDKIKFEQAYLRSTNDVYPIFAVTNAEKSVNTDKLFWKLKLEVDQSYTTNALDLQVSNVYTFLDYDKTLHTSDDATFLTKMLAKNSSLRSRMKDLYDQNSGFYLI